MAQQTLPQPAPAPLATTDTPGVLRGLVAAPTATFAALADARPWRQGLTLYLLTLLAGALAALARPAPPGGPAAGVPAFVAAPAYSAIVALVAGPLGLLLAAGLLYQVGLRQGGDGPFARLLVAQLFAAVPVGLVNALLTLAGALAARATGGNLVWLSLVVVGAADLWALALTVCALRASMRLSLGGAIVTVLLSIVVGAALAGLAFCVLGAVLMELPR
jgi:hypothetical protein